MDAPQNAYDVTAPLLRQIPQTALDAVFGAAGLVSAELKLTAVGRGWDEFMSRSGRSDLARNAMLGSTILLFFRNEEQRRVFESLLHSMRTAELGVHTQVVDLGSKDKQFYVQLHVQGLWQDGVFAGYLVHCLDITREHVNRLALIERDRELQTIKESGEKAELAARHLNDKLRSSAEEIAQREAQLRKMTEKSVRMEKNSKESQERAEKAVEKSARLQHELDKFRKQHSDNSSAAQELAKKTEELEALTEEFELHIAKCEDLNEAVNLLQAEKAALKTDFETIRSSTSDLQKELDAARAQSQTHLKELEAVRAAISTLEQERDALSQQQSSHAESSTANEEQLEELRSVVAALNEEKATAEQEYGKLKQNYEQALAELNEARAALETQPEPVAVPQEDHSAEVELLTLISLPACSLDLNGNLICATGSFWEVLGAVPEQGTGQNFAQWLSDSEGAKLEAWLNTQSEMSCDLLAADGSAWKACAIVGADGSWQGATVEAAPVLQPAAQIEPEHTTHAHAPSQSRAISRELAEEFSNLLTGVLGHASLAAAEMDSHSSADIMAIEKTAREAAQLVRKLTAISGSGKHVQGNDVAKLLKQFVKKLPKDYYTDTPQLVLCEENCTVNGDTNSLKMVLDALAAHARDHLSGEAQVCFTLSLADQNACLSLSYNGYAGEPAGWEAGLPPALEQPGWDLVFAREVVRAMGGELELSEDGERAMLLATLPLASRLETA